jgi:diazepam-binding inhibitor (GABA receptor modulating acyl-CoA-binding protein)
MFKRVLAFIAIAYAAASAAWTPESAKAEMSRLKDALTARMTTQGKEVDQENLIELYALFKQATEGDKPEGISAGLDVRKHVLYARWAKKAGMPTDAAVAAYQAIVKALGDVE